MKRAILLLLCLTLLCVSARAEIFCVSYYGTEEGEGYALLLTEDGVPLTPPQTYAGIYEITPSGTPEAERLYVVEPLVGLIGGDAYDESTEVHHHVALMNARGELVTGFDYGSLQYLLPGHVFYTMPNWSGGVMDAEGNILLSAEYAYIASAGDGAWLAVALDGMDYVYQAIYPLVVIDADGARHDTGLRVGPYVLGEMACGLCPVANVAEYGGKAVYVNARGRVAFEQSFDDADSFHGRLAVVSVGDGCGLIDTTGAAVTPLKYEYISYGKEAGIYIATARDAVDLIDADTGAVIASLRFDGAEHVYVWSTNAGIVNVSADQESYIYSMDGALLARYSTDDNSNRYIDAMYARASGMPQRLVETVGRWPEERAHLLDLDLNQVGPDYQSLSAALWQDGVGRYNIGRYALRTDEDGETLIDWRTYLSGVCDENGGIVVEPVYQNVEVLSPDRFWVTTNDGAGLIDAEGHWLYSISDYEALMD